MKRYDHLYEKLLDFANILNIYEKQIKPNTKNKDKIEKYEHYLLLNLKNIQTMLLSRKIEFHDYYIFLIREPKYRIVMSQQISDKIINHLIAKYLLLDVFFSFKSGATAKERLLLIVLLPIFHISYGVGSIGGLFKICTKKYRKNRYTPKSI